MSTKPVNAQVHFCATCALHEFLRCTDGCALVAPDTTQHGIVNSNVAMTSESVLINICLHLENEKMYSLPLTTYATQLNVDYERQYLRGTRNIAQGELCNVQNTKLSELCKKRKNRHKRLPIICQQKPNPNVKHKSVMNRNRGPTKQQMNDLCVKHKTCPMRAFEKSEKTAYTCISRALSITF